MFNAVWGKFAQNEEMAHLLLSTGRIPIVEADFFSLYWSIYAPMYKPKILSDNSKWIGKNRMGVILCLVRQHLEFFMMDLGWHPPPTLAIECEKQNQIERSKEIGESSTCFAGKNG